MVKSFRRRRKWHGRRSNAKRIARLESLETRLLLAADPPGSFDQDYCLDVSENSQGAQIRGTKFEDVNGNGMRDDGEPGLAGVTIFLDSNGDGVFQNEIEQSTTTAADGTYAFMGIQPGEYSVNEVVPDDFVQTFPSNGSTRLFVGDVTTNPNGIREIDPASGLTINQFSAPLGVNTGGQGLAFDGSTLFLVDLANDILFELNPDDGAIIDQIQLPDGAYDGAAVVSDTVYISEYSSDTITAVNPDTNVVSAPIAISGGAFNYSGGLGESEGLLVATTTTNDVIFIDPTSGVVQRSFNHGISGFDAAATGFDGEIYLGFSSPNIDIHVYDSAGILIRTIDVDIPVFSLGGSVKHSGAYALTIGESETISGIDFGNQSIFGTISGTKFEDVNGNGQRDVDEGPLPGVTIYLDLNSDGLLQPDEPSVVTDESGAYRFEGLLEGEYVVREIVPTNFVQTAPVSPIGRLFATDLTASPRRVVELDPTDGSELNEFQISAILHGNPHGIAFDGTTLFLVDAGTSTVHEVDPDDGAVLDSTRLPSGTLDGVAAIDGLIYVLDSLRDQIVVFDPVENNVVQTLVIPPSGTESNLHGGLGEFGGQLVAGAALNNLSFIDPSTGQITRTLNYGPGPSAMGVAGFRNELFLTLPSTSGIRVLNAAGAELRHLPTTFESYGLASGPSPDVFHQVSLEQAAIVTGLDFGNQSILGTLAGTKFFDANENGVHDQEEYPIAGVTIYLDLNEDRSFQPGEEPSTVTDLRGDYAFEDILNGTYIVREVIPDGYLQTAPRVVEERLFGSVIRSNPDEVIEINPSDGTVLNRFSAPTGVNHQDQGLAFDGQTLFMVDYQNDTLFELDPDDGTVLDSTVLPSRLYDGVAVIGDLVYILDFAGSDILVFDRVSDTVVKTLNIDFLNPGIRLRGGLGELNSPDQLIASTTTNEVVLIDPVTGIVSSSFSHTTVGPNDVAVASLFDEIYLGFSTGEIQVFSRSGTPVRSFNIDDSELYALAGAVSEIDQHVVTLQPSQTIEGLDFGNFSSPPIADAGGPYSVAEGGLVRLDGSLSSDAEPNTTLEFQWDLDGDGVFGESGSDAEQGNETGVSPHFSAVGLDGPTVFDITLMVTDDSGLSAEQSVSVNVTNVTPTFNGVDLDSAEIDENGSVTLTGSFSDSGLSDTHTIAIIWGDGSANTIVDLPVGERTFSVVHQYLDDGVSGIASNVFSIAISLQDDDGGTDNATLDVTVNNVVPYLDAVASTATRDSKALPGELVTLEGLFSDAGILDTHSVVVDWGEVADGDPADINDKSTTLDPLDATIVCLCDGGGTGTFTATHSYSTGGIFTITVTLIDDDTGESTRSTSETFVTGARVVPSLDVLQIVGSGGDDRVDVRLSSAHDHDLHHLTDPVIRVQARFDIRSSRQRTDRFIFDPSVVQSIHIVLCDGNDRAHVHSAGGYNDDPGSQSSLVLPTLIEGDAGNDRLTGGDGPNIILGGPGNDRLRGGNGNDVLSGGEGRDRLTGGRGQDLLIGGLGRDDIRNRSERLDRSGSDILIAGETTYDDDGALLRSILDDQWVTKLDQDQDFDEIVNTLVASILIPGTNVFDDTDRDRIRSIGRTADLVMANSDWGNRDRNRIGRSDKLIDIDLPN